MAGTWKKSYQPKGSPEDVKSQAQNQRSVTHKWGSQNQGFQCLCPSSYDKADPNFRPVLSGPQEGLYSVIPQVKFI